MKGSLSLLALYVAVVWWIKDFIRLQMCITLCHTYAALVLIVIYVRGNSQYWEPITTDHTQHTYNYNQWCTCALGLITILANYTIHYMYVSLKRRGLSVAHRERKGYRACV